MPSRLSPSVIVAIVALVSLGAAASDAQRAPASAAPTPAARATHVLNRLTFGPRPGEVDRVVQMGIDRWIDQQLRPELIVDSAGARALEGCPLWTEPVEAAVARLPTTLAMYTTRRIDSVPSRVVVSGAAGMPTFMVANPSARGDAAGMRVANIAVTGLMVLARRDGFVGAPGRLDNNSLLGCRLMRLEGSDQQLLEVMTDFWQNHFSIFGNRLPSRGLIIEWDRAVIRPHALGRFRDLLAEVAYSPQMLEYLDNSVSAADPEHANLREHTRARGAGTSPVPGTRVGGLNENYGRELLELHTMGADGGYTQMDVTEVARAFMGWTHSMAPVNGRRPSRSGPNAVLGPIVFEFDSTMHDADAKVVLGHTLPAGRGTEDGDQVLDILARHPSTARHISRKLAVRFVSDSPPETLIDRAAATFLRTDGDIREVVRTIVTSPEFFSPTVYGAKIKSPQELVLSTRRALGAPVDTAAEVIDFLIAMDQRPYDHLGPDGWPETGTPWLNFGAMLARFELATRIGRGEIASIPVEAWPAWTELADQPYTRQVDGVIRLLLHGRAAPATRAAMIAARPTGGDQNSPEARRTALRELVVMALASPQFQRR